MENPLGAVLLEVLPANQLLVLVKALREDFLLEGRLLVLLFRQPPQFFKLGLPHPEHPLKEVKVGGNSQAVGGDDELLQREYFCFFIVVSEIVSIIFVVRSAEVYTWNVLGKFKCQMTDNVFRVVGVENTVACVNVK